jgi:hypothetical protein
MAVPAPALQGLTAGDLLDTLESTLHASRSEWLFLRELRVGTGRRNNGAQRVDALALNTLPHTAMKRVCYEVKTSRTDFLCELKQPLKRRIGMRYSNEFYFVTPGGLVQSSEIPPECGLIEIDRACPEDWKSIMRRNAGFFCYEPLKRVYCMITVVAPWRDTPGPTWQLVAAMLRNQQRGFEEKAPPGPTQQRLVFG